MDSIEGLVETYGHFCEVDDRSYHCLTDNWRIMFSVVFNSVVSGDVSVDFAREEKYFVETMHT